MDMDTCPDREYAVLCGRQCMSTKVNGWALTKPLAH